MAFSVSVSFVTVIAIKWHSGGKIFAPYLLTLQAVTVILREVNSVCNIHYTVQQCSADEYVP